MPLDQNECCCLYCNHWPCLVSDGEQWDGGVSGSDEAVEHGSMLIATSQQYSGVTVRSTQIHTSSSPQKHIRYVRVSIQGCSM